VGSATGRAKEPARIARGLETGTWDHDPDKASLRRVNFVILLAALDAIATGAVERISLEHYKSLPRGGT
jgi:hypothetical protein